MRALLAEDDVASRDAVRHLLRQWGLDVIVACDGTEAWEILQNPGAPDLVVLDWEMPGMAGLDVCRRLREREGGTYPYVILLSGHDQPAHRTDALEAGADAYLSKSCSVPEMKAGFVAARRHLALYDEMLALRAAIRSVMTYDPLTGLEMRPSCLHAVHREVSRAADQGLSLGLMLIEVDHMPELNERYGRRVGDAVLREAAGRITPLLRPYDVGGRYRGNQFLLLLPHVDATQLREMGEGFRLVLSDDPFRSSGRTLAVTASVGATLVTPDGEAQSLQTACLRECEDMLGKARDAGRNRVVVSAREAAPTPESAAA